MKRIHLIVLMLVAMLLTGAFAGTAAAAESSQVIPVGVVNTARLNVRDYPLYPEGNVITKVSRNEVYVITGRSPFNYWFQIRLSDGRLGWVNGRYLDVYNAQYIPVVDPGPAPVPQPTPVVTPVPVQAFGSVTAYFLNVRTIPNPITGPVITRVQRNQVYPVVGKNGNSSWWQIQLPGGALGWVSGTYLTVSNGEFVPITDNSVPPGTVSATATVSAFFLNVRDQPNAAFGQILAVISRNQTYPVIGRTADNGWWQIRLPDNRVGWVSGFWVMVTGQFAVPVTY